MQGNQPLHQLQMLTPQHQQQLLLAQQTMTSQSANDESRRLGMLFNNRSMSMGKYGLSNSVGDVVSNLGSSIPVLPRGDPHMLLKVWVLSDGKNSPTKGKSSEQAEEDLTLKLAFRLKGHEDDVTSLCFRPDSQRIIAASRDGSLRVWAINYSGSRPENLDIEHTEYIGYLPQDFTDTKYYDRISISPDGKILAVAGASLLQWIFVESGEILETIGRAHNGDITCMTWAPVHIRVGDKQVFVLATVGVDKDVKLWAAPSKR